MYWLMMMVKEVKVENKNMFEFSGTIPVPCAAIPAALVRQEDGCGD